MDISSDYRDLFKILNRYRVRYLVVGAYAVTYYSQPRFTKDIDIWVMTEEKNARRLYNALKEFGAPLKDIYPNDFVKRKMIYQIGVAPVRVDIMMDLGGIDFKQAWRSREKTKYGGISVNIIGIKELIKSKSIFKREQDRLDLKYLKRIRKKESPVSRDSA